YDQAEVLRAIMAMSLPYSGKAKDAEQAWQIMNELSLPAELLWSPHGKMTGRMVHEASSAGDLQWLIKAVEDSEGDMAKFIDNLAPTVAKTSEDMFPTLTEVIEEERKLVDDIRAGTKKMPDDAPIPKDDADIIRAVKGSDPVPGWMQNLAKFDSNVQGGIYGPVNKFFAGLYMGMNPAYAMRNAMSNMLHVWVDHGTGAVLRPNRWAERLTEQWLGYSPYTTRIALGGPAAGAVPDILKGERNWGSRATTYFLEKSRNAELAAARKVVGSAVEKSMKTQIRAIMRSDEIKDILKSTDLHSSHSKKVVQMLIQTKGDVRKTLDWLREAVSEGYIDDVRGLWSLTDEQLQVLDEFGRHFTIEDELLKALGSDSVDDFNVAMDVIQENYRNYANLTAYDPQLNSLDLLPDLPEVDAVRQAVEDGQL
ncbi:hypothetical protein LCGC14_2747920, partial [marine sediment metagenome]